ncbi:MAG: flagellin [Bryobacteraceae bacterium]
MLSIQTNVNSLVAQQNLNVNNTFQSKTITQLTSGYRINESGDDAAGLAVANKFRNSEAELTQGVANGNDATAQLQIMDGGISNISQILDRLQTLATQSASGTFTGSRTTLNQEFQTDLGEVDRQAQSIGLNAGGLFNKSLNVYLGTGSGSQSLNNGIVTLNLTGSAVDSQSLGLKGMEAVNLTSGSLAGTNAGTNIGASSTTSVQAIVGNTTGANPNQEAIAGYAAFSFSGAGFSDANNVGISVNLAGVTDTTTLAAAVNAAIQTAGNGTTAAATAFKNANIVASVHTDSNGGQELAFSSSTAAFQVQAGDQMANALLGNVAMVGGVAQGTAVAATAATTVTGVATTNGTFAQNQAVQLVVNGGGLASPVSLTFSTTAGTVSTATAIANLETAFSANSSLQAAGLSMSENVSNQLVFTSATGQAFNVQVTGDTANLLGLGSFLDGTTNGVDYLGVTAAAAYAPTTANGTANLQVSLNGAAATALTGIDLTAGAHATGAILTGTTVGSPDSINLTGADTVTLGGTAMNIGAGGPTTQVVSLTATQGPIAAALTATSALTAGDYTAFGTAGVAINILVDGTHAQAVVLAADANEPAFLADLNTKLGGFATASINGAGDLVVTSATTGAGSSVAVTGGAGEADFGFSGTPSATGNNGTVSLSDVASQIQAQTYGQVAGAVVNSQLVLTTVGSNGQVAGTLATGGITYGAGLNGLAFGVNVNGTGNHTITLAGGGADSSGAALLTDLNGAGKLGAIGARAYFDANNGGVLTIASNTAGLGSSIALTAGTASAALGLSTVTATAGVNTKGAGYTLAVTALGAGAPTTAGLSVSSATGVSSSAQDVVNNLNAQFSAGTLAPADLVASQAGGIISINSTNGTQFRLNAVGPATANLGFGTAGASFTAAALTAAHLPSSSGTSMSTLNAYGISNSAALSFTALQYGDDKQAITFSATNSSGALETQTISLQDNAASNRAGANIDSAIDYINQQLQQSTTTPALQSIVAVKQANAGDTAEQINFVSSLSGFTVSVGGTANGDGVNAGVATAVTATPYGSSANMAIDTQAGAEAAVTAVGNAVTALGAAQAAVGIGENQLAYGINLAQSQVTNEAAAESNIRDANVAQQAANLTKAQVLQQASIAAMAQANSAPQAVLALLRT